MQLERLAVRSLLASMLALCASGCDETTVVGNDAGQVADAGATLDGAAADAAKPAACKPSDCDGLPIPAIACADGPTSVVCERAPSGACLPSVRCGPRADAGAGLDGGAHPDAGSGADGGSGPHGGQGLGQTCGGIAGLACASGLFCDYAVDAGGTGCSGVADASGRCANMPGICPAVYAPVCGCNSHSYPSLCDAHANGISEKHQGLCTVDECMAIGGRPVYSDGASTPACNNGEVSFQIPGKEPAICCVSGP